MTGTTAVAGGWGRRVPIRPLSARTKVAARVAVALGVTAAAYHYSLLTLIENLGLETPLAYLGLVPFIALALAATRALAPVRSPSIHDRQLDWIVGVPLLVISLAMVVVLPVRMSTEFWTWRIDLLSLPVFLAGAISLVFGVRALWRVRVALAFLLLAWPVPYTWFIESWLDRSTELTLSGLNWALNFVPVAENIGGGDGSLFAVTHAGHRFILSVASACAGVNGMVGFVLVGSAFTALVRGRRLPKVVWLLGGMALLWALNVVRILLIFAAGQRWGEEATLEYLHPYVGLVAFNVGVILMLLTMPLFGLRFRRPAAATATATGEGPVDAAVPPARPRTPAVPRARLALTLVTAVGVLMGVANVGLREYGLVADDLGDARLIGFSVEQGRPQGWGATHIGSFGWGRRFFGEDSSWLRFSLRPNGPSDFRTNVPVIADVISTPDLSRFTTYGLEACYDFHRFEILKSENVDLGGGVTGHAISWFEDGTTTDWTTVYWHWPVRTPTGTRYERVVLMMGKTGDAVLESPAASPSLGRRIGLQLQNALRKNKGTGAVDENLTRTRSFLVGFAREVVQAQGTHRYVDPIGG